MGQLYNDKVTGNKGNGSATDSHNDSTAVDPTTGVPLYDAPEDLADDASEDMLGQFSNSNLFDNYLWRNEEIPGAFDHDNPEISDHSIGGLSQDSRVVMGIQDPSHIPMDIQSQNSASNFQGYNNVAMNVPQQNTPTAPENNLYHSHQEEIASKIAMGVSSANENLANNNFYLEPTKDLFSRWLRSKSYMAFKYSFWISTFGVSLYYLTVGLWLFATTLIPISSIFMPPLMLAALFTGGTLLASFVHRVASDQYSSYKAKQGDLDYFCHEVVKNFMLEHYPDVSSFHNKVDYIAEVFKQNLITIRQEQINEKQGTSKDRSINRVGRKFMIAAIKYLEQNHKELFSYRYQSFDVQENTSLFEDSFTIKKGIFIPVEIIAIAFVWVISLLAIGAANRNNNRERSTGYRGGYGGGYHGGNTTFIYFGNNYPSCHCHYDNRSYYYNDNKKWGADIRFKTFSAQDFAEEVKAHNFIAKVNYAEFQDLKNEQGNKSKGFKSQIRRVSNIETKEINSMYIKKVIQEEKDAAQNIGSRTF